MNYIKGMFNNLSGLKLNSKWLKDIESRSECCGRISYTILKNYNIEQLGIEMI